MSRGSLSVNFGPEEKSVLAYGILSYKNNNSSYATKHDIFIDRDGQPSFLAGVPLDHSTLTALVRDFSNNAQVGSFLPETVLSAGMSFLVWWVKPAKREIHFACDGEEGIGRESAIVPHPGLIFAVNEESWYVFAVKGTTRPKATTPLFQAPHFNVSETGRICTGNVTIPSGDFSVESMAAWEKAYFGSRFSHPNVPKLVKYEGGSYPFWRSMLDNKFSKFPNEVLVQGDMVAGDLVTMMNGGKR